MKPGDPPSVGSASRSRPRTARGSLRSSSKRRAARFAQEYGCQFMDAESQPFRREDVERAFQEEVQPWAL